MSPLSILLLFGSLTCFGTFATASGGFECSVKHICDYVTKKCKHVTICEEYNDDDNMDRVAAVMSVSNYPVVRAPADFLQYDTNVDQVISQREFLSRVDGQSALARHMFVEADTNGDNCVTCNEFENAPFWASQQKERRARGESLSVGLIAAR